MDKEVQIHSYELADHKITHARLIKLKDKLGKVILTVPMEMFAVTSFFRCIVKQTRFAVSTHKMFLDIMKNMGGKMRKIVVDGLQNGQFFATIYFTDHKGKEYTVSAEAGNALIMSLRAPCNAYALESVIKAAKDDSLNRVHWYKAEDEESLQTVRNTSDEELALLSPDDLDQLMEIAAEIEDYEFAARLKKVKDKIQSEQ
jgi:bifunctional DNase/RNase